MFCTNCGAQNEPGTIFCTKCGAHVRIDHPKLGLIDVRAAAPQTVTFKPTVHLNYEETVLHIKDGLPKLRDFPKEIGGYDHNFVLNGNGLGGRGFSSADLFKRGQLPQTGECPQPGRSNTQSSEHREHPSGSPEIRPCNRQQGRDREVGLLGVAQSNPSGILWIGCGPY